MSKASGDRVREANGVTEAQSDPLLALALIAGHDNGHRPQRSIGEPLPVDDCETPSGHLVRIKACLRQIERLASVPRVVHVMQRVPSSNIGRRWQSGEAIEVNFDGP